MISILVCTNLLLAVMMTESTGRADVRGSHGEVGILQIRQCVVTDINRAYRERYKLQDFAGEDGVELSLWAFYAYAQIYRARTPEQQCKLWNCGPSYKQPGRQQRAARYWKRVQRWLPAVAGKTLEEVQDEG